MPLKKSVGNMYPWVTHTHCHLGGECPHKCSYCYVSSFPFGRPPKYSGPLRLIEKEFSVNYGKGRTIFIENCNDLFAENVPQEFIYRVLRHCKEYPENTYVFQSKNPERMFYVGKMRWPENHIIGVTIETNRYHPEISSAPEPIERADIMTRIQGRKFVTIEPVLDFDLIVLAKWILNIKPEFVNIGADSKKHNLPEPDIQKVEALIKMLTHHGIEIREKRNLGRLRRTP